MIKSSSRENSLEKVANAGSLISVAATNYQQNGQINQNLQ